MLSNQSGNGLLAHPGRLETAADFVVEGRRNRNVFVDWLQKRELLRDTELLGDPWHHFAALWHHLISIAQLLFVHKLIHDRARLSTEGHHCISLGLINLLKRVTYAEIIELLLNRAKRLLLWCEVPFCRVDSTTSLLVQGLANTRCEVSV